MQMTILESGEREMFKAAVHAVALGLTLVMDGYNLAAWLKRRERHLAVNTLVYTALAFFEVGHVVHHRASALEAAALAALAAVTPASAEEATPPALSPKAA